MAKFRKTEQVQKNVKTEGVNNTKPVTKNRIKIIKELSTNIKRKRGRSKKLQLVVLIKRSAFLESLIQNLPPDNKMVSNSVKHNILKSNCVTPEKNQTSSTEDRLKFIHSFKITTQLNSQTRKIDMISLPVEKVSMKNETSTKKKFSWPVRSSVNTKTLVGIFNVTSSNAIFKSASLETDTSSVSSNSPKKSLTRASSIRSLDTISNVNRWSSSASNSFINESHTDNRIILNRSHATRNSTSSAEEYDQSSGDATHVRSESSGYHSEHKLSDNSPASSTVSSPKRLGNSNYSNCFNLPLRKRSPVKPVNNNSPTITVKRKSDFKTPTLPLCKRPPTRIKPPVNPATDKVNNNIVILKRNVHQLTQQQNDDNADDAISLYAESIMDVRYEPVRCTEAPNVSDYTEPKLNYTSPVLHPLHDSDNQSNINNGNISSSVLVAPLTTTTLSQNCSAAETHTSKVDKWIASTPTIKDQFNFNAFYMWVKKLCFYRFRRGYCRRDPCRYNHNLPPNFQNSLRDLDTKQFIMVYNEIAKISSLFKEVFDLILTYFKEKDLPDRLIYNIVQDIFNLKLDKTPFIKKVIDTLRDMGFSFVEAVEEILLTHGRQTESLLDILLMFIVEEDDCLENNWHFIDKLTKFRKNKLDYGVVGEIFQKCCNTNNPKKEFCENIYKDLIIKNHIELDKVDRNLVIKYINMLYQFNLTGYAEQLMQYNRIGGHEVINCDVIPKVPVHNIEMEASTSDEAKFESDSSPSSSNTISSSSNSSTRSSSDNSTPGTSDNQNTESPECKDCVEKATTTNEVEEMLDFTYDNTEVANELNHEEQQEDDQVSLEESPEYANTGHVDHTCQVAELDFSINQKYNYTTNDLEAYLNYANKNTYSCSSNYYRLDEPDPARNNSLHVHETTQCGSPPPNEHSTPIQESGSTNDQLSPARSTMESDLSDGEIMKLMTALNSGNLYGIFTIMKKSADSNMSRSFVVHTITTLKNMQATKLCKLIIDIFENLEMLHSMNQSLPMKSLMKLLAFNVLLVLDRSKEYSTATRLLNIYSKDMDSFLDTVSITTFDWLATKKLRYIFIFKIFARDKKLKEALKLLKSNLDLFQDMSSDTNVSQIEYKKRILSEFLDAALQRDLHVARESILYLKLNMDWIKNILNMEKYLNLLIVKLLNSYTTYKMELLGLLDNIVNGWYKHLKNSVMRGIFVQTYFDLPERRRMDFFNLCVERKIYEVHEGLGNSIDIPRNLVAEEIQFMLHLQFYKICRANFPLEDIIISTDQHVEIDEYLSQINIFTNSVVDGKEMVRRIQNLLSKFEHFPSGEKINTDTPGMIVFSYKDAQLFLAPFRSGLPPITKYR